MFHWMGIFTCRFISDSFLYTPHNNLKIFIQFLIRMLYGYYLFSQIYAISAANESKLEVSDFYFQIK